MNAGQESCSRASMVAGSIAQRIPVMIIQPGENENLFAEPCQRLEDACKFEITPLGQWPPIIHHNTIRHIDERETERHLSLCSSGKGGRHSIEHRQGDGYTHSLEKGASRQMV